ncbi:hypothetical protein ACLMJK_007593 [Lecanora helva]
MESHIITPSTPLSPTALQQIADARALDEISNSPGAVRQYLYSHPNRDKSDNTFWRTLFFLIYQTTRHGPQNGFRFCVVYDGFRMTSETKLEEDGEDDIDRIEKPIPQGHMEVVFLGPKTEVPPDSPDAEWWRSE